MKRNLLVLFGTWLLVLAAGVLATHVQAQRVRVYSGSAPTCTSNCGTSPAVTGTDASGLVTMGSTGSPASGWVLTFNSAWASAPACLVAPALTGMAVGKLPIVVATTTTTMTVTTNGTAPATSDKYAFHCAAGQ